MSNGLPQTRLSPFYPGLMGVHGSDVTRGIRTAPTAIVMFVDKDHNDASDAQDGTNPEAPMATIQAAVTKLIAHQTAQAENLKGSVIVVGGTGYAETVTVPITAPHNVTLMGCSGNPEYAPTWTSGAAAEHCLTLLVPGWTVTGLRFLPNTAGAGVYLNHDGATIFSDRTRILGNDFDGMWSGLYGIYAVGCPDQVFVIGNRFHELDSGGAANNAAAIYFGLTPWASPYLWTIADNIFQDNDRHIAQVDALRGGNGCLIESNRLMGPVNQANGTAIYIDMRGGTQGVNTVVDNVFSGDYSNTGGYYANAANPGNWVGNIAEDLLEPEVADNGFTIAVPAA